MKKCPNCGRELHDEAIFCFNCMSEVNERQEINLAPKKRITFKAKIAAPVAAVVVGSAAVFGGYAYSNSADKNAAVEKSAPPAATTITTNAPTTTTLPPATTVTTTTTTKQEPDKAALAADIAGGAALAEKKAAAVTTTTTAETVTEPVAEPEIEQDIPQENTEDTQQNEPAEPEYYSSDGASQMTLDLLDYVNPLREKYGLKPLHASGQLDQCLEKSLYQMDDASLGLGDPYEHLADVGLPTDSKLRGFYGDCSSSNDYDEAYSYLLNQIKKNINFGNYYGDDMAHGMEDYTYVGVCFFHDQNNFDYFSKHGEPDNASPYQCYVWLMK